MMIIQVRLCPKINTSLDQCLPNVSRFGSHIQTYSYFFFSTSVQGMVADEFGDCYCGDNTIEVGGNCVAAATFAIVGSILGFFILVCVTYIFMRHKNAKSDEVWQVHPDELHLLDEVIGQGSFGVVLLAVRTDFSLIVLQASPAVNFDKCLELCHIKCVGVPWDKGSHQTCHSIQQEEEWKHAMGYKELCKQSH